MRRVVWGFAALSLMASSAAPSELPSPGTVSIDAAVVVWNLGGDRFDASGQAVLSYRGVDLHADNIVADRGTGEVEASGNLAFLRGGQRLEGDSLTYDIHEEEGVLENARMYERGLIIQGERIEFSPQQIVAHEAQLTTCDRPEPHYGFAARRISLTAAETEQGGSTEAGILTLEGARLDYHGRRLLKLPRFSIDVGQLESDGFSPVPVTGFSSEDGPFASFSHSLGPPQTNTEVDLSLRLTSYRGVRSDVGVRQHVGALDLIARYVIREDNADRELRPDELDRNLYDALVHRTPEYGVKLPGLPLGRFLNLRAEWLRGRYEEWDAETDATVAADRASRHALFSVTPYRVARGVTFSHAAGWRKSSYSAGESLTIKLFRNSVSLDLGRERDLALSYIVRDESGETPFQFDRVGATRQLLADLRCRLNRDWRFHLTNSTDLADGRYDEFELSFTRTIHCLDYTLGWRSARSTLFFGVGLAPTAP